MPKVKMIVSISNPTSIEVEGREKCDRASSTVIQERPMAYEVTEEDAGFQFDYRRRTASCYGLEPLRSQWSLEYTSNAWTSWLK